MEELADTSKKGVRSMESPKCTAMQESKQSHTINLSHSCAVNAPGMHGVNGLAISVCCPFGLVRTLRNLTTSGLMTALSSAWN